MNDTVKILVDGEEKDIEAKQFTLVTHQGGINIEVPTHQEIAPHHTVARFEQLSPEDWKFLMEQPAFKWAVGHVIPHTVTAYEQHGASHRPSMDAKHWVGMLLLILECLNEGRQPFIRTPECHMHPSSQARMVDIIVGFSNGKSLQQMYDEHTRDEVAARMEK